MTRHINTDHLWRNDITGLRAVAVLPVLLFHAFPSLLPGGFYGVDVFFVISGYLISGIIFRGMLKGTFSYRDFYAKRIRRILPNLLLLLSFVAAVGYAVMLATEYEDLGKDISASAAFFQNFRLLSEVGYFTEEALRQPLLHLWSLAIEEQFYIVFPILCTLIWRFWRSPKAIGLMVLAITIGSLTACLMVQDRNFNFYFPLTRFWEMGCGIVLAYVEAFGLLQTGRIALGLRHVVSVLGLAGILVPMVAYQDAWAHPGYMTLCPVLGAVALLLARPDAVINRTVLSFKPMTFVGLISYSLYLWHWPLLAFVYMSWPQASAGYMSAALALSFVLATIVYYGVENPVRISRGIGPVSTTTLLVIGLVAAIAVGQVIRKLDGMPWRDASQHPLDQARAMIIKDSSMPKMDVNGTKVFVTKADVFPQVLFAGDSHMEHNHLRVKALSQKTNTSAAMVVGGGLYVLADSEAFYTLLADERIKSVVLSGKWGGYVDSAKFLKGIERFKAALRQRSPVKVTVILDAPWDEGEHGYQGTYNPFGHYYRFNSKPEDFLMPYPKQDAWKRGNEAIRQHLSDVATVVDIAPIVCPNQTCDLLKWYRDDDHLQERQVEKEGVWLDAGFDFKR